MNYNVFKLSESENNYYFYFISPFSEQNNELALESIEHYISNESTQMNQYLHNINFDEVKIEKVNMNPIDVINKNFPADDKNMLISDSYKAFIPLPKEKKKREVKPKEPKEKKDPKPRGKKCVNVAESVPLQTN